MSSSTSTFFGPLVCACVCPCVPSQSRRTVRARILFGRDATGLWLWLRLSGFLRTLAPTRRGRSWPKSIYGRRACDVRSGVPWTRKSIRVAVVYSVTRSLPGSTLLTVPQHLARPEHHHSRLISCTLYNGGRGIEVAFALICCEEAVVVSCPDFPLVLS